MTDERQELLNDLAVRLWFYDRRSMVISRRDAVPHHLLRVFQSQPASVVDHFRQRAREELEDSQS